MRTQLVGYLTDALEPEERERVEQALRRDPQLQRELEILHECLEPLESWDGQFEPPAGLAARTCTFVIEQGRRGRAPAPVMNEPLVSASRWSLADLAVAAGIFIAAGLLFFPAIQHSRTSARLAGCQNNLRQLGTALTQYSDRNHQYFPPIPAEGKLAAAGIYAVRLNEHGLLNDSRQLFCPAAEEAGREEAFRVPTAEELQASTGAALEQLRRQMGGSYGYSLGYVNDQGYQHVKNQRRANFALMADAPTLDGAFASANHGGAGQNVLYEDGHVKHRTNCLTEGCRDHIFLNDEGRMAAGTHVNDAVVGPSGAAPLLRTIFQPRTPQ